MLDGSSATILPWVRTRCPSFVTAVPPVFRFAEMIGLNQETGRPPPPAPTYFPDRYEPGKESEVLEQGRVRPVQIGVVESRLSGRPEANAAVRDVGCLRLSPISHLRSRQDRIVSAARERTASARGCAAPAGCGGGGVQAFQNVLAQFLQGVKGPLRGPSLRPEVHEHFRHGGSAGPVAHSQVDFQTVGPLRGDGPGRTRPPEVDGEDQRIVARLDDPGFPVFPEALALEPEGPRKELDGAPMLPEAFRVRRVTEVRPFAARRPLPRLPVWLGAGLPRSRCQLSSSPGAAKDQFGDQIGNRRQDDAGGAGSPSRLAYGMTG